MLKRRVPDYLLAFIIILLCSNAVFFDAAPFGVAVFIPLAFIFNPIIMSVFYSGLSYLCSPQLVTLYTSLTVSVLTIINVILSKKVKLFDSVWIKRLCALFIIFAQLGILWLFKSPLTVLLSGFFSLIFYYFSLIFCNTVFVKRLRFKLSEPEAVALGALFVVIGLSVYPVKIHDFNIFYAVGFFAVIFAAYIGRLRYAMPVSACFALGLSIPGNFMYMALFCFMALISCIFTSAPRFVCAFSALMAFAMFGFFFNLQTAYILWALASCALGGFLFCIIPPSWVKYVKEYFDYESSSKIVMRHIVNRSRFDEGNLILSASAIFEQMSRLISQFDAQSMDSSVIVQTICSKVCDSCQNSESCRANPKHLTALNHLAQLTQSQNLNLAQLPEFFTAACIRTANILRSASEMGDRISQLKEQIRCETLAKTIVCEQLKGVSDILTDMGTRAAAPLSFDKERERAIICELNFALIECADAFVSFESVTVLVRNETCNGAIIQKAVSKVMKQPYTAFAPDRTQAAGWSVVYLRRTHKYEAVFGSAGSAKQQICGDTHSFIRVGSKLMASLVDGMGSGENAAKTSEAAISLIESFYKAGFESSSVLSSVNRFLKLPSNETYCAADVCVIDLENAQTDIFKIGSPATYIKTNDTVLKIQGGSLPIGVVDEMRPYVSARKLRAGDLLIMVTDGIFDAFSADELADYINGLNSFNPQAVAKSIFERALALYGGDVRDDMSVVTLRLFENKKIKCA